MVSTAGRTPWSMATLELAAVVAATCVHLSLALVGMAPAPPGSDLIYCRDGDCGHLLKVDAYNDEECDHMATALNELEGVNGIKCGDLDFLKVDENCDQVATVLNKLEGVNGIECTPYDYLGAAYLGVPINNCDAVATALYNTIDGRYRDLIAPRIAAQEAEALARKAEADIIQETTEFKPFYYSALPISGITFLVAGNYAYCGLGGDTALVATLLFALFVAFRVFDLMSDWGMYSISLATYHTGTALRHASLAFSIIGTILLVVDLSMMRKRARHWFGVDDSSESLKKIGCGMLSIVLLEDLPQMILSIKYLVDINEEGRNAATDPIAITSLVLSGISMVANAFIGIRSLC